MTHRSEPRSGRRDGPNRLPRCGQSSGSYGDEEFDEDFEEESEVEE